MSASRRVDKATFLDASICRTRGWYTRNLTEEATPSAGDLLRMEEGIEIGRRARLLYPGGVLVQMQRPESAAAYTARLITDRTVSAVFEATFCAKNYVAKADVLIRQEPGWHLLEVKSR